MQSQRAADSHMCRELDADESGPEFWTDFLKASLHPRSVLLLQHSWTAGADSSSSSQPLGWGQGQALMSQPERAEEFSDRVRRLAEECDNLQVGQHALSWMWLLRHSCPCNSGGALPVIHVRMQHCVNVIWDDHF